jgi:PBSX family phage terminase large subunit
MMTINLSPWQSKVLKSQKRYKVICTGRRAGKTLLSTIKVIQAASEKKRQVWYLAPTYRQAKQILWITLLDYLPQQAIASKNETDLTITLINGSIISLKGCDNVDSLRGVRVDFAIFDECAFIEHWDQVWKVIRPTLVDSRADCWFISSPNGFNHFKEMYDLQEENWESFHYTSYDNPYILKEEIEEAKTRMDEDSFAQEFLGEFRKMTGLIYKEFHRDIHMVEVPNLTSYMFTRAIDFGFAHKTALIYFAIDLRGTAIYAYDGVYDTGLTVPEIVEIVKIKDSGKIIGHPVADSSQPATIEELRRNGINFEPIDKVKDSVENGIARVAELLKVRPDTGKPTLMFNKNLPWIADEFERYRWMENKSADNIVKNTPFKVQDDAMDCIRYFAMHYKKQHDAAPVYNKQKWAI